MKLNKTLGKVNKTTVDKGVAVFILSVVLTAIYIYCINNGAEWITYAYIIAGCVAACAYMIIMRGLYTHPDKTVFSYDLPEEERERLAEAHRKHWKQAQPLLVLIIAIVISFIAELAIDYLFSGLVSSLLGDK